MSERISKRGRPSFEHARRNKLNVRVSDKALSQLDILFNNSGNVSQSLNEMLETARDSIIFISEKERNLLKHFLGLDDPIKYFSEMILSHVVEAECKEAEAKRNSFFEMDDFILSHVEVAGSEVTYYA